MCMKQIGIYPVDSTDGSFARCLIYLKQTGEPLLQYLTNGNIQMHRECFFCAVQSLHCKPPSAEVSASSEFFVKRAAEEE